MTTSADFPPDLHYLVEHQTWARLGADGTATIGITTLGLRQSGDLFMCRPKPVGSAVQQGRAVAVVELAKAIVSVRSPVTGVVVAVNPRVMATPELVHRDPYGEGWLVQLRLTDPDADRVALIQGDDVAAAMRAYAEREGLA